MTGGGFGGSAIALVPDADRDRVAAAVAQPFAARGGRARLLDVLPAARGPRRE